MADTAARLEACKAAASVRDTDIYSCATFQHVYPSLLYLHQPQDYQSQLQTAGTKDEALTLAIGAAENLMKALKLSSNADEKKQLKAQCSVLMDVADRIKNTNEWTPVVKQQPKNTRDAQIGHWAANVDVSTSSGPAYEATTSPQTSSFYNLSPSAAPANTQSASGNSPFSSVSFPSQSTRVPNLYKNDLRQALIPLINLSDEQFSSVCGNNWSAHADMRREGSPQILNGEGLNVGTPSETLWRTPQPPTPSIIQAQQPSSSTAVIAAAARPASETPIAPHLASHSHIHRLTEPVSTRKRSRKEDIILLKASVVNGFKCPPWDKNPSPTDFVPQDGQELFTYVGCVHASFKRCD
jgi:calpain-7